MSRSRVYRRLAVCVRHGLVWHKRPIAHLPGVYGVTKEGAAAVSSNLGATDWSWQDWQHRLALTDLAIDLEEQSTSAVLTERELQAELYASGLPRGPRPHLPDLAVGSHAIELEITSKSAAKLRRVLQSYLSSQRWSTVTYFAPKGAIPRLQRIVAELHADSWVQVQPWGRQQR